MSEIYQKSKVVVLKEKESRDSGLTQAEAEIQLKKVGYNELEETGRKSTLRIFLEQFTDFLVIILIVASAISFLLGDAESAIVISVVITMNAILGTIQHKKAEKSLDSLKQLSAPQAKVSRDGKLILCPSREVVPGDVVSLEAGDYICADGRILENASLKVNESALTGESVSVDKKDIEIPEDVPLGDRLNMLYAGSFVTYGRGKFLVTETGMNTEVGKIASLLNTTAEHKTPLQENLDQFGKKLSILIIVICILLFGLSILRGEPLLSAFMFAVALAVAAIPEALSSIVTIVLAFGTQKMARENAIIRKLHAVEGLGSVSVICSDKTGTLTQNRMKIMDIYVDNMVMEPSSIVQASETGKLLYLASILCNDAKIEENQEIGDPTEVAFIKLSEDLTRISQKMELQADYIRRTYERLYEIPFDSDRKMMSTVHNINGTNYMFTKGAVDVMLSETTHIELNGVSTFITEEFKAMIHQANESFSVRGLRVLAFGIKKIETITVNQRDETDLTFLGLMSMMDPPREESIAAVAHCIWSGIRPIMITGDHKVTASAIAGQIGILTDDTIAVEGMEIDKLTDEELDDFVPHVSVYARVSPEHKIRIVQAWQKRGHIVAMTGDGVNDAPALKKADIGVAMGITGSEVAKDAAAMVLADDNFATIVKAIENGRNLYANIKKSIKFLLSGNTAALLSVLYASIAGLAVPFAPVHLLFINLLTDSLPAIALGLDPHTTDVMKERPRLKSESILTRDFLTGILEEGFIIGLNTMIAYHIGLMQSPELAQTMAFSTLCLSRLVHGFNSKSDKCILGKREMWNNNYLWLAFFAGFLLLHFVLLVPAAEIIFDVVQMSSLQFGIIYLLALSNLFEIQIVKFLKTKLKRQR
ncbi:MAG: cation-translocating P-type ATPase [Lachnospiraceae bacterium]